MKFSDEAKTKAEGRFPSSLLAMDWFTEQDLSSSEDIVLVDRVSSGAFATVYTGLFRGKYYAVKKEPLHAEGDSQANLLIELSLLQSYPHERLVKFVAAAYDSFSNNMLIVMELCARGDLRHFMQEYVVGWPLKVQIATDIARGLNFMHDTGIIHRDIKTSNILIDDNFNGKICDFSFSIFDQSTDKLQLTYGTDEFMSPEIALALDFSFKSDIFSFGIVLSEMITEREPSKDFMARRPQNMFAVNEAEVKECVLDGCPVVMEALALQCCDIDVSRRPLSSDLIEEFAACLLSDYGIPLKATPPPVLRTAAPPSPPRPAAASARSSISKEGGDSSVRIAMLEQQMRELQSENRRLRSDISSIIKELTPPKAERPSDTGSNGFRTPRPGSGDVLSSSATTPAEAFCSELDSLQTQLDMLKSKSSIYSSSNDAPSSTQVASTPLPSPTRARGAAESQAPPQAPPSEKPSPTPAREAMPSPQDSVAGSADHLAKALNSFLEIADRCSATTERSSRIVAQMGSSGEPARVGSPFGDSQKKRQEPSLDTSHGPPRQPVAPRRHGSPAGKASRARSGGAEKKPHVPVDYSVPPKHPAPAALARWHNRAYEAMSAKPPTEGVSLQRPSLQP